MSGFAKNGVLYPCNGVYGIRDDAVSSSTGWSSQKIMDKLAHVKSIIRVDAKPTLADGTITYVKDGATYTTTDTETWFYYIIDDLLYKTTFIDGVEYTKDDSDVVLDDYVEKVSIVTALDDTVTDEQVPSAKAVNDTINKSIVGDVPTTVEEINSLDRTVQSFLITSTLSESVGLPISPKSSWICTHYSHAKGYTYPTQIALEYAGARRIMYRVCVNGSWQTWETLCSTMIPNVARTAITLLDTTYFELSSATSSYYSVTNGICAVRLELKGIKEYNATFDTDLISLPKPKELLYQSVIDRGMGDGKAVFQLTTQGNLRFVSKFTDNPRLYVSFTYPVAEL